MDQDKYSLISDSNHFAYEFLSEGPKGTIKKVVFYEEIEENVYNLAFGDWDEREQTINDKIRTNNSDQNKVLATVASTIIDFIEYHPNAIIFVQGSTASRTRLYQMGINLNWEAINKSFSVQGFSGSKWEPFIQDRNYEKFVLKAK